MKNFMQDLVEYHSFFRSLLLVLFMGAIRIVWEQIMLNLNLFL